MSLAGWSLYGDVPRLGEGKLGGPLTVKSTVQAGGGGLGLVLVLGVSLW